MAAGAFAAAVFLAARALAAAPVENIKLPPGFEISVFAEGVKGARSMTLGAGGTLFVGTRGEGKVYAVTDRDGDGRADEVVTISDDLYIPNGVAYKDDALYVAEISRILRFDDIEKRLKNPPRPVVVYDGLPKETAHGWKFIRFGPDGKLYVPIGVPCNVCDPADERFGTISRIRPDGTGFEIFARGVRNSVGFDWDPATGDLWFTDNGRDMMGDDVPPDELNHAPKKGLHFGFPYCHGGYIPDPRYGEGRRCEDYVSPAMRLGPHVASLGMRFYTGKMFPEEYRRVILIAEHGSWNRSVPIGYRVTAVRVEDGRAVSYDVFAEGWLQGRKKLGRPVDVQVMPDGALLVSDDHAGAIYRISYKK